ncbi:hypothetical protein Q9233_007391 [Columba guinea]|nr:hypothetical protein Q9233_007391 [Columba guinea]
MEEEEIILKKKQWNRAQSGSKSPNCPAGPEPLFPKSFTSQRRLGIIILTQSQCSFLPKFSIHIETKYEDNKGSNDSIFDKEAKDLEREVCFIDIASDEIPERYYKESEDPKYFKSQKTGRGQLKEGWRETHQPIMCSYKLVTVKFEVWGLQTRVEQFVHKVVRDILLIGHRQAFAWVDEWYDMTMDDVREYEKNMHEKTNIKVCNQHSSTVDEIESHATARSVLVFINGVPCVKLKKAAKLSQLRSKTNEFCPVFTGRRVVVTL